MRIELSDKCDLSHIREAVMDSEKMKIKLLPSKKWLEFSWEEIRFLMHETATYVLPTTELLDFLSEEIEGYMTVEIGAGNGFIGRNLHIPMTDSMQQKYDKKTVELYRLLKQPLIRYPRDVIKMDALSAVRRFHPECVLACYVTHLYGTGGETGNYKGVDFKRLLNQVKKLILVGNSATHRDNPLMDLPHREIYLPGLITRGGISGDSSISGSDHFLNKIFIWDNQ